MKHLKEPVYVFFFCLRILKIKSSFEFGIWSFDILNYQFGEHSSSEAKPCIIYSIPLKHSQFQQNNYNTFLLALWLFDFRSFGTRASTRVAGLNIIWWIITNFFFSNRNFPLFAPSGWPGCTWTLGWRVSQKNPRIKTNLKFYQANLWPGKSPHPSAKNWKDQQTRLRLLFSSSAPRGCLPKSTCMSPDLPFQSNPPSPGVTWGKEEQEQTWPKSVK